MGDSGAPRPDPSFGLDLGSELSLGSEVGPDSELDLAPISVSVSVFGATAMLVLAAVQPSRTHRPAMIGAV